MRFILPFLFIVSLLIQTFSKQFVVLQFQINQSEIAKTLCVKKEVEGNTCQGKCHLKKELNKLDSTEKKQGASKKMRIDFIYIKSNITNYSFGFKNELNITNFCYLDSKLDATFCIELPPPQV